MSEPEDRREGGSVPPWDPSRGRGPDDDRASGSGGWSAPGGSPAPGPSTGGWQAPGGSPPPGPSDGGWQGPGGGQRPAGTPPTGPSRPGPHDPWGFGGALAAPRPGIIPLRPLALGELLDGAFQNIRAHPRVVLGISAVIAVITVLVQAPFQASFGTALTPLLENPAAADLDQLTTVLSGSLTLTGISVVVSLLGSTILTGLLVVVISRAVLGAPIDAAQIWAAARPRLVGLLGVVVLVTLATLAVLLVALLPALVVSLSGSVALTVALMLLGLLAGVAGAIAVTVALTLAAPAYVLEDLGVVEALRRSWQLVSGRFWPILGALALAFVIVFVITGIIGLVFGGVGGGVAAASGDPDPYGFLPLLVTSIGAVIGQTLAAPFQAGVSGLLYVDQRMRKEGFDIQLQQAARGTG